MKIISHRGGAKLAPENSIEAIEQSRALKVIAAEVDIHISKDGKLVVFHDFDLKRLAGINKPVESLNLSELRKVQLKNGALIPTLAEIISSAGDMPLYIEGKGGNWAKLLTKELQKFRFSNPPTVISFNEKELKKFRELSMNIDCYLVEIFRGLSAIKTAKKNGFQGIDIHYLGMNKYVYRAAKREKLKIILYSINSERLARHYLKYYPDIELTTDSPQKLVQLINDIK